VIQVIQEPFQIKAFAVTFPVVSSAKLQDFVQEIVSSPVLCITVLSFALAVSNLTNSFLRSLSLACV
jgi:hypothetical protein